MFSRTETAKTRPPAVAGSFYPSGRQELADTVTALLAAAHAKTDERIRAIIAPHAGYIYSGPVASEAFTGLAALKDRISRVVVIGPAHYVYFRGIAVPSATAFTTPLGEIPVDTEAIAEISDLDFISIDDRPHQPEHALEVELPFLQATLGSLPIIPLLVGDATAAEVAEVLARLWRDDTLVVVSSDLSHYHTSNEARRLDNRTAEAIEHFDGASLGPDEACGHLALSGMLLEAKRRGLRIERLALQNSADTSGDPARVVGYGAWRVVSDKGQQT